MKIRLRSGLFLLMLLLALPFCLYAAEEPIIYVIQKGDTLWGLSEKFLKDPKYWPNLWSKNQVVTNPHLIYPGQRVRFVDGHLEIVPSEEVAAPKAAAPVPVEPEVAKEKTYTVRGNEGGMLEKELIPSGRVLAGQHGRIILGEDDIAYTDIGSSRGGAEGQKYTIMRRVKDVKHPLTNEVIGTKIFPLGVLQLTQVTPQGSRSIINASFREVEPGDWLLPYQELKRREVALKMATRPIKGLILETIGGNDAIAVADVVYLDLGNKQGIEVGNMLYVVRDVQIERMLVGSEVRQLPQEVVGAVVVVETGNNTSTALVVKSIDAIFRGDKVVTAPR